MLRLSPLLLLMGCTAAEADNPEVAFRHCVLEQARALKSNASPSYATAKKFSDNCRGELKSLPISEREEIAQVHICALSGFVPPCQPVTD